MYSYDPVQVRSQDTSFLVEHIPIGKKHVVTPMEKMLRRVSREFSRRKLIGDIVISDEEFSLLVEHMRNVYLVMYNNRSFEHMDAAFCTALVQIGIRYYQRGNYWLYFEKLLNFDFYNMNHRKWIRDAFVNTLRRYDRILLNENELVSSILMHCFVTNHYTNDFFDFLFAYYRIDLDRDIRRLDKEALDILIENIKRNDNTARTYQIVEQTANAVRASIRSGKTRIRRYLKLIDKAFWDEQLPPRSGNRLTRAFIDWQEKSDNFNIEKKKTSGTNRRGKKYYSSPYLIFDQKSFAFSLVIPTQTVRFEDASELFWAVSVNDQVETYEIIPYEGVTGYKTDEVKLPVHMDYIFSSVQIELKNAQGRLRLFRIPASQIRFFDDAGFFLPENLIDEGDAVSFSRQDFVPISDAVIDSANLGTLRMTYYSFIRGDIVNLPDGKPISVGRRVQEGLLPRGSIEGVAAGAEYLPVYKSAPSVLVKTLEKRTVGMAVSVNGKLWKADDNRDKMQSFDLMDRTGETGYIIHLIDWGCQMDGIYTVTIDIPNDRSVRQWRFMLVNGMDFSFEEAPYIFKPNGTLCTPNDLQFQKTEDIENYDSDEDGKHWGFRIDPQKDAVKLLYKGVELSFRVPVLSYCFRGEEWTSECHNDVWHSDFEPVLYVRYPASKIIFSLDETDSDDDEHSLSFTKIQGRNLFECDLTPFKSGFSRDIAKRKIYFSAAGMPKPIRFLDVFTKSIVVSGVLAENYDTGTIDGTFDIVGKANYYVDLYFKEEKLADKVPIIGGKVSIKSKMHSGSYTAHIFESENNEFGFGDEVYYEIGVRKLELVNARDLAGKSIRIVSLRKADDTKNELRLRRSYVIYNLISLDDLQGHFYSGIMVATNRDGENRGIFKAYLEIPEITELNKGYITFDGDGESLEFMYDDTRNILAREPQEGLHRTAIYRRYSKSLYPEDYVFEYEFVTTDLVPVCNGMKDYKSPARAYLSLIKVKDDVKETNMQSSVQKALNSNFSMRNSSIEMLKLSNKTYNSLRRAEIKDLKELCSKSYTDLLKIRDLGKKEILEIVEVMKRLGMQLPYADINL